MNRYLTAAWMAAGSLAASAATNEIIVSATRIETPVESLASSVSITTAAELENTKVRTLPEALQMMPGVSMSSSGGPGRQASVYLRGAKPQHTLILVDGVRMNGQLDLAGYDMTNFQLLDIERIEILKGPQSTLYGSDAMAGVIHIITRKGRGRPAPYIDAEIGSFETYRAATGVSGGTDALNYSASISYYEQAGPSALKNNTEKDGTRNTTVATRLGTNPTDTTELTLTLRYIDAASDYDDGFGTAHDRFRYDSEQLITRGEGSLLLLDDLLESRMGVSFLMLNRNEFGWDGFGGVPTSGYFDADTLAGDWVNTLYLHENHTLLLGVDAYRDDYDYNDGFGDINEGDLNNAGFFATYRASLLEPWVVYLGSRYDKHSEFEGETTFQASTLYTLAATDTRFKGSYGTAFKAPSSYQLFSLFGNPDLRPETSRGWEVGIEQSLATNRLTVGATYFNTAYDELIDYNFVTFSFDNIAHAETEGVELYTTAALSAALRLRIGYTYLDNDDDTGGTFSYRRPSHQMDADVNYAATDALNLNLYAGYVGEREDVGGAMDAYTLVNLAARYQLTERMEMYGRLENLLDEDYETVAGYNTPGISLYVGVKMSL